jgi:cytochrome P450
MSGLGACLLVQVSPPPGAALREKYLKLLMYYLALRRVRIDNRVTLPPGGLLSSMAQRLNTSTRQTTRAVHEFDHLRLPIGADHTPFEFLEALRDEAVGESRPIGWSESHGGYWVVAGYTEAEQIFRDPKTFSNRVVSWPQYKMLGGRKVMLGEYDPPEHTQYRRLIQAQFSPKRADALAASVRSDIALLIDEFIGVGRADVAEELAGRIGGRLVALLCGLPPENGTIYRSWTKALGQTKTGLDVAARAAPDDWSNYFDQLLEERCTHPGSDIMSLIVYST